jgi:outer membrane immunogenic protein
MKKLLLAATALAALVGTPALAADMAAPVYKAPPMAPPVFSWTGCHVGADVGIAWVRDKDSETFTATGATSPFTPYPTNTADPDGAKVGGYLGCDYQFASPIVAGIEGDAEWANIKGGAANFTNTGVPPDFYETRINSEASIRGRLGYAANRALFYVTGGAAWARVTEHDVIGATGTFQDTTSTRLGWTAGLGADYAFTDHLIGRVEYRYTGFSGTFSYVPNVVFPAFTENHKISENALRAGLAYKF